VLMNDYMSLMVQSMLIMHEELLARFLRVVLIAKVLCMRGGQKAT
jgi:hypothetical protein